MFHCLFFTAFLSQMPLGEAGVLLCDDDTDCQDGSSCIENICTNCVKCDLIFRKGNGCVSDFNDCGNCLRGYEEISLTDNSSVKKPCRPVRKKGNLKECTNDNNCPPDSYCSVESCVKCFDCRLMNRLKPVEKCAKEPDGCGPCLAGYLAVPVTTETNYMRCEKVNDYLQPYNIASGSAIFAIILVIGFGVSCIFNVTKYWKGNSSSKSSQDVPCPSAPLYVMDGTQCVNYIEEESAIVGCERQEMQQAKVYKLPSAPYYPKEEEDVDVSEHDSVGQNENNYVYYPSTSSQREETVHSYGIAICGECARTHRGVLIRSLSEVISINSDMDSQGEQPVDMNVLRNDSAENNSDLVAQDTDLIPETSSKEPTEGCIRRSNTI